jgi:hypothetical protein
LRERVCVCEREREKSNLYDFTPLIFSHSRESASRE